MSNREDYVVGTAAGASIQMDGETWSLVLVRELRHAPEKVWKAITDPEQLRHWSPFDADRNLSTPGPAKLTTVGAPSLHATDTVVTRSEAPRVLEYAWGGNHMRWELEAVGSGTRLTLWHNIHRSYISLGATGWHVCLDVLDRLLSEQPLGRIVGPDALKLEGWQRLHQEYATLLGVEMPRMPPPVTKS